jgi:hypothetical protein
MGIRWKDGGYSADVRMRLLVNGKSIPISHIEGETIILRCDEPVPSGHAQIVISVDGRQETKDVIIHTTGTQTAGAAEYVFS